MFSNSIDSARTNLFEELNSKFDLTHEQNENIFLEIKNFLKNILEDETIRHSKDILDLINKKSELKQDNYIVEELITNFEKDLNSKLNLGSSKTKKLSEFVVKFVLRNMSHQLAEGEKTSDLKSLLTFLGLGSELKESVKGSLEKSSGRISDYFKRYFKKFKSYNAPVTLKNV